MSGQRISHRKLGQLLGLLLCMAGLLLWGCSGSEPSKELIHISQVELLRFNAESLTVRLEYDLAEDVELPLPYLEVLVFPLEPEVRLAGTLDPFKRYAGLVSVSFPIPAEPTSTGTISAIQETCCTVSLKGLPGRRWGGADQQSGRRRPARSVRLTGVRRLRVVNSENGRRRWTPRNATQREQPWPRLLTRMDIFLSRRASGRSIPSRLSRRGDSDFS